MTDIATFDYGKLQFYEIKCRDGEIIEMNPPLGKHESRTGFLTIEPTFRTSKSSIQKLHLRAMKN